jgi:hypothetical protein
MTILYDHRTIEACACVHNHLRHAVAMLDRSEKLRDAAYKTLEKPVVETCDAVEQLREAGKLRRDAEEEVREALRAIEDPPPNVSTDTPPPASEPGSTPTTAA